MQHQQLIFYYYYVFHSWIKDLDVLLFQILTRVWLKGGYIHFSKGYIKGGIHHQKTTVFKLLAYQFL